MCLQTFPVDNASTKNRGINSPRMPLDIVVEKSDDQFPII